MARRLILTVAALPLALAACGKASDDKSLDGLDGQLVEGNVADPTLTASLRNQIMVDPGAGNAASDPVALPGGGPLLRAPEPVAAAKCEGCDAPRQTRTLGQLAAHQAAPRIGTCASGIEYSTQWAQRLPADLPLYPQARVTEAAGAQTAQCALRVVSFSSAAPLQRMLDWYYTVATRAGYSSEHSSDGSEHVLCGTRDRDDGAYVLFMTTRADGGTDVDLLANNGI